MILKNISCALSLKVILLSFLVLILGVNAQARVIFTSDFENGLNVKSTKKKKSWGKQTCDSKAIMPVKRGQYGAPSPRAGKYMLRTKAWSKGRPMGCTSRNKIRTELIGSIDIPPNKERWIGFSTYIPKKNGIREDKSVAFLQLHFGKLNRGRALENFRLDVKDGQYHLISNVGNPKTRRKKATISSIQYNKWTDWVIRLKFTQASTKNEGYVQVWKNGKLVFDKKGHSLRKTTNISPAGKIGMYVHGGWPKSNPSEMVMYHDEYRIGDEKSSYREVAPKGKPKHW